MRRSLLFLPSNQPGMLLSGTVLPADAVIFDLEDAVSPDQKDAARFLLVGALSHLNYGTKEKVVRINSLDTAYWEKDLEAILPWRPDWIMPPKAEDPEALKHLIAVMARIESEHGLPATKLLPLIETARGVENAFAIASLDERVGAIFLGAEDYSADLRCARTTESNEIFYARTRLVNAARAAGIEAIDTPFTDTNDLENLKMDAVKAKGLGFAGKACISPRHLDIVNAVFSPTASEIRWAEEVMVVIEEGRKQGKGAVSLRGKMIDKPIVMRAERILESAKAIGML